MRPIPFIALLAVIVLICSQSAAQDYGAPLGSLSLSFGPDDAQRRIDVAPMENFQWYVRVAIDFGSTQQNDYDGLLIWEGSIVIPPEITVLSVEHVPDLAFCDNCSSTDWRALLGRCMFADQTPNLLMRYEGKLLQDADDLVISLGPSAFSNFGGTAPGWRKCVVSGDALVDLHPFASDWNQPIYVNSTVTRESSSWSALKGRY